MSRLSDREQAVWDKRNAGLTFKQIAKELGLCPATVSFAYGKAYRKIEYGKAMKISKLTELEVYKRALRLASENALSPLNCNRWGDFESQLSKTIEYFLNQARKELEDERN